MFSFWALLIGYVVVRLFVRLFVVSSNQMNKGKEKEENERRRFLKPFIPACDNAHVRETLETLMMPV